MAFLELETRLELPPSTVHGLVRTLVAHGLVVQERGSNRYQLGPAVLRLGNLRGHHLTHRQPADSLLAVAGACAVQNSPSGSTLLALNARVADVTRDGCDALGHQLTKLSAVGSAQFGVIGGATPRNFVAHTPTTLGRGPDHLRHGTASTSLQRCPIGSILRHSPRAGRLGQPGLMGRGRARGTEAQLSEHPLE